MTRRSLLPPAAAFTGVGRPANQTLALPSGLHHYEPQRHEAIQVTADLRRELVRAALAGHALQNVCLQATALRQGFVTVGAFADDEAKRVVALPASHELIYRMPIGLMPVGRSE